MVRFKATIMDETQNIQEHINKMVIKDELLREHPRQQQTREEDQAENLPWQNKTLHRLYH